MLIQVNPRSNHLVPNYRIDSIHINPSHTRIDVKFVRNIKEFENTMYEFEINLSMPSYNKERKILRLEYRKPVECKQFYDKLQSMR